MKKKWTWSKMLLAAAAVALFVSGSTLFAAKGGGGKPPKDDPPPPAELPDVRYRIKLIEPAVNANGTGSPWINYINNLGQVVGKYQAEDGTRMFLYDPRCDCDQAFDMNAIVTAGIPDGWRLRSALAINDYMVVVGNMEEISTGQVRPIAIDLAADNPVVDLLPAVDVDKSHAIEINENGDILGMVELVDGLDASWIYNPGLYGDPSDRDARDPGPLDMSTVSPELFLLGSRADLFQLNNPVGERPAQIAGVDVDGVAFRYTLGDAEPEGFPEVNLDGYVAGLNDAGTFCGLHRGPKVKGQIKVDPFRFNPSFEPSLELLPMDDREQIYGMNSSEDLISAYSYVYHNDWGWVAIDDLVVADMDADVETWRSELRIMRYINDRGGPSSAGQITGMMVGDGRFFVLTPELP